MILLKKIKLINFLSYEETEINFAPDENVLIDGLSGTGKSSIFDGIIWALYGEGRCDNRSIIHRGAKKTIVTLELQKEKETYTIKREATLSGKHIVDITVQSNNEQPTALPLSGVRDTQEWIDKELIGASYLLFINSVAYVQDNGQSFVSQTATKRKELLLEIIKAEDYQKLYENARDKLQKLNNDIEYLLGQKTTLRPLQEALEARIKQKGEYIKDISHCTTLLGEITPKRLELEASKAKYDAIKDQQEMTTTTLDFKKNNIKTLELKLKAKWDKIKEVGTFKELLQEKEKTEKELVEVRKVKFLIQEKIDDTPTNTNPEKEIYMKWELIKTLEEKTPCPSEDECPYYSKTIKLKNETEKEINLLNIKKKEEDMAFRKWQEEFDVLPDLKEQEEIIFYHEKKVRKIIINSQEVRDTEAEIPVLEDEIASEEKDITKLTNQQSVETNPAEIEALEEKLLKIKQEEAEATEHITRSKTILESIVEAEKELKKNKEQIVDIKNKEFNLQSQLKKISLVKQAFGSKGIKTMVVDYILPKLEDRVNDVLSRLSDFRVRFDTQRVSTDGKGIVEGLFITVINESNEEMSYESYSGGEKLKITVSISEALATLQKVGFRLFDETFLALDENSSQDFVKVLMRLQINFDQILCISHLLQIKGLFENKINVNKYNGKSNIKRES